MDQYGLTVRARRRAVNKSQFKLARAISRSPAWVGRLENLQAVATADDRERIEAFLCSCEAQVALPSSRPQKHATA